MARCRSGRSPVSDFTHEIDLKKTKDEGPKRGDPCPKCGVLLVVKPGMFALREHGMFSGLVCEPCGALWDDPENSFLEAAIGRRDLGPPHWD